MKKIFAVFLVFALTLSLFSCSGDKKEENGEKTKEDIASMTAQELYEYGVEKNKTVKSLSFETVVLFGEEEAYKITTNRIRNGYDDYNYERLGREKIYLVDETAYISGDVGNFSAPSTGRGFDQYLTQFVFALYGQDPAALSDTKREGNTVSYSITDKKVYSLYDSVLENDQFTARALSGKATFDEEGILTKEEITLTGASRDGTEATLTLKTTLVALRDEKIKVDGPEEGVAFVALTDISLPGKITLAVEGLYELQNLQGTVVFSNTITTAEGNFALNKDLTLYKKTEEGKTSYYLSRQELKQGAGSEDENSFYQCQVKDGTKKEAEYNVTLGTILSQRSTADKNFDLLSEVKALLPLFSDLSSLTMTEDMKGYSITFTLSERASQNALKKLSDTLSASGRDAGGFTVKECSGTLTIAKDSGCLSAFAYTVSGEMGGETAVARYSFLLDKTSDITFPQWQNPTATQRGEAVEFAD